jgi:prepilin-type N-terminal cleavage/methylation domain-containing protein
MRKKGRWADNGGFTMMEVIVVLILLGLLSAFLASRMFVSNADVVGQAASIRNSIRYAQSMAMKYGTIWGMKCAGAEYWVFRTNSPDVVVNQMVLPAENSAKIALAGRKVTMGNFTVFFDASGRPYTAYTNQTTNTPLAAVMNIAVNSVPAGTTVNISITPETGFVP